MFSAQAQQTASFTCDPSLNVPLDKTRRSVDSVAAVGNNATSIPSPKTVIFYNAFVNPKSPDFSRIIIDDQIQQVYNSSQRNTTLYYNILGYPVNESICPPDMDCRKQRYIPEGDEVETLQDLYQYCLQHINDTVIYLHDKGSFSPTMRNNYVRRLGTLSATSEACGRDKMSELNCNICIMKLQYLPNPHTQGNHWAAHCSYVSTLIPPKDYEIKRRTMFKDLKQSTELLSKMDCFYTLLDGILLSRPYMGNFSKALALGRYAMEAWILSGPLSSPCHTMPGAILSYHPKTWRPVDLHPGVGTAPLQYVAETATLWFRFYGRLYEYQTLYNQVPPKGSWFYDKIPFAIIPEGRERLNCTPLITRRRRRRRNGKQSATRS
jgi:hypothetical protein